MTTYSKAFYDLKDNLQPLYDEGEATAIAHAMLEHITGEGKLERLTNKDKNFTTAQEKQYNNIKAQLQQAVPLQYIIGKTWFMNREFSVNSSVLIPRPETEELVQWIVSDCKDSNQQPTILDIGTGSGCIAVSLKLELPESKVEACDVSPGAVLVARANADMLGADMTLQAIDFTYVSQHDLLGKYDIIVSNPPYIPYTEKHTLHANVVEHEPHVALFVPGDEPLLFYDLIADFGKTHLNNKGLIYCELDRDYSTQAKALFESKGYADVEIRKDLHGNTRMLKAKLKK
ncbi:MAG: peptide chain release factor N(5)-glutamine methyltransferase [Bacteroidetes bacterium]|nr:peptide chain release factor N(5)-glutamine methyltransferase [Bacteroidota bacterium]